LRILAKNNQKTRRKAVSQKNTKNEARGRSQTPKIQKKPTCKNPKNQKIAKKLIFEASNLWQNFDMQQNAKKGEKKTNGCVPGGMRGASGR